MQGAEIEQPLVNTILLIDDEKMDAFVEGKLLEHERLAENILQENSPFKALEYLYQGKRPVGLILINMEIHEMGVLEFIEEFEKLPKKISSGSKIIVMSPYLSFELKLVKAIEMKKTVLCCIEKPLNTKILRKALETFS